MPVSPTYTRADRYDDGSVELDVPPTRIRRVHEVEKEEGAGFFARAMMRAAGGNESDEEGEFKRKKLSDMSEVERALEYGSDTSSDEEATGPAKLTVQEEAEEAVLAAAVAFAMDHEELQTVKAAQTAQRERERSGGLFGKKSGTPAASPDRKAEAALQRQIAAGAVPGPGLSLCITVLRAEKLKDQALFTKMDP